ncbi:helix-turn-helix domain-containing protein [Spirosoma sp. HMF3257]|uniref:Uncharacterized protein n=1 Tax=Spirosoma telluris TaxID=2183553 RepID=A0A327NRW7_9BACT|nr:helix-turn-helix domain-containing protein [Spirosoma telluris]RAI77189.1 hypothetical protein HMF3257_28770 [Spirosoma telluris]
MVSDSTDLLRCKQLIERKLDWGASESWTSVDFENLQQRILDETGVSLSASTLRRIWGRVDYQHLPSNTTLNTLAQFAGYPDWRTFIKSQVLSDLPPTPVERLTREPVKHAINWVRLSWIAGLFITIVLIGIVAFDQKQPHLNTNQYSFSSKPLTHSIPNSVIFTYNASASPTDSVYIQQSWNPRLRALVDKDSQTYTSIYYEPGYYRAKLLVGKQIVKEHPLLIPTNGWLGTIATKPVPVYMKPDEFIGPTMMRLPVAGIQQKNVPLQPEVPLVKYFNVGNFDPVPLADFSFSSDVKNEYGEGAAACQQTWIELITDDMPITIPLCTKGCVSELTLLDGSHMISGKKTDLSRFGVDYANWINVSCKSDGHKLYYHINGELAYEAALPKKKVTIVGIAYGFRGTGAVRNINLQANDKQVFHAF